MKKEKIDIGVVIMSCDKYHDLWDPFFYFFEKNWPDCPYPIYLATNSKVYQRKNIQQIHSNIVGTWSEETHEVLNKIPCEKIIYLQDDYLILKKVNTLKIDSLVHKMAEYKADYLRLFPSPGPNKEFKSDSEIGEINSHAPYRTSLQCAIWNKQVFIDLLKNKENQWEFEINSPERSKNYLFLSVKKQKGNIKNHIYPITYYYLTAVIRGRWRWEAAQICKKEGIVLDTTRKIETRLQLWGSNVYETLPLFFKKGFDFILHKF